MICSPSRYMPDFLLSESSYAKLAVIDSCYESMNEGVVDQFVMNTATSYTRSTFFEMLDNIKERLLAICTRILSYLNNYILNTANLADKYRNLIIERYQRVGEPVLIRTYQYPRLKDKTYPVIVKSSSALENEVRELQTTIVARNYTADQSADAVDKLLKKFSKEVLGVQCNIDDIRGSTQQTVRNVVQGREVVRRLDKSDLNEYIDEIKQYRPMKDDLARLRKTVLEDYENLKKVYSKAMSDQLLANSSVPTLKSLKDPEAAQLSNVEVQRFANINVQMSRLFNGFITIYSEAFNTRLTILHEKIECNRATIVEVMNRTGVFAAINTKTPSQQKVPIVFDPSKTIKT